MVEDGFEQAAGFGLGGNERPFQSIAQRHQFIHLGDDGVFRKTNWSISSHAGVNMKNRHLRLLEALIVKLQRPAVFGDRPNHILRRAGWHISLNFKGDLNFRIE